MIKYLGSKRLLIPQILGVIADLPAATSVIDLFSGTARVGHALKRAGYQVFANDFSAYGEVLGRAYVQADAELLTAATALISELNQLPGTPGYATQTWCEDARFFQPKNGARIDAIRDSIAARGLSPELEAVALVSLMEAADRVDSTTGVHMAFLKQWARRAANDLELRVPDVLPQAKAGKGKAFGLDAVEASRSLAADVAYLDPPYNQHKYLGNYHIWETLVRWDHPDTYGIAKKRVDCQQRTSAFNKKAGILPALTSVIQNLDVRHLVVSFSDEGFVTKADMEALLATRGAVTTHEIPHPRYVGAKIGIHNPLGEKVGTVGRLRNVEYLFVVRGR